TTDRRHFLDAVGKLDKLEHQQFGDPETEARIAQYEMAYRMQSAVPDLTDLSKEPEHTFEMYGPDVKKLGTFASNCLLARRLAERGVRFIQLYHRDWDHHAGLPAAIPKRCQDVDHHGRCFTVWMAGGGIKPGITLGETDDFGYNIVKDPVHVHDLQATILNCLGIDHTKLTYLFQGR